MNNSWEDFHGNLLPSRRHLIGREAEISRNLGAEAHRISIHYLTVVSLMRKLASIVLR